MKKIQKKIEYILSFIYLHLGEFQRLDIKIILYLNQFSFLQCNKNICEWMLGRYSS